MVDEMTAIREIIKANAEAVYKDSAQPSIRVLGKSLAQCVSLFATPVGRMAHIFEKNIHKYIDKLEGFTEDQLNPPDTRVLVPILEKMRFIEEEKVANYYAEILATATKKEHAKKVMITFIEILNRLTADEIQILEFINSDANSIPMPEFSDDDLKKYGLPSEIQKQEILGLGNGIPVIDVKATTAESSGYRILVKNFSTLQERVSLSAPENLQSYIDNMISLGLLERVYGKSYAVDKIYSHLEAHETVSALRSKLDQTQNIEFERGRLDLTHLAHRLLALSTMKK